MQVDLYELRDDPRNEDAAAGRSINLALSDRGLRALSQIGMREMCMKAGVKMFARMIHNLDGSTNSQPYGRTENHFILSISRLGLNQMILTEAEKRENVNLHFHHRINGVDLDGKLKFTDGTGTGLFMDLVKFSILRRITEDIRKITKIFPRSKFLIRDLESLSEESDRQTKLKFIYFRIP